MSMIQIVGWLPVVVDFVAILDWRIQRSEDMREEEDDECGPWVEIEAAIIQFPRQTV
jgi:hypothetical protein